MAVRSQCVTSMHRRHGPDRRTLAIGLASAVGGLASAVGGLASAVGGMCVPRVIFAAGPPMILVDQPDALMDVPISIELAGFAPHQPVALTATQIFPSHSRWQARATFTADENGHIAVARQAPASGDYDGVAAMGLVWSAQRVVPATPPISGRLDFAALFDPAGRRRRQWRAVRADGPKTLRRSGRHAERPFAATELSASCSCRPARARIPRFWCSMVAEVASTSTPVPCSRRTAMRRST